MRIATAPAAPRRRTTSTGLHGCEAGQSMLQVVNPQGPVEDSYSSGSGHVFADFGSVGIRGCDDHSAGRVRPLAVAELQQVHIR